MKKILLSFSLLLGGFIFSQHKFLDAPKLTDQEVQSTKSETFPEAQAEVLYRSIHHRVDYNGYIYSEVVDRVKIYNKNNVSKYLNHEISLYDNGKGSRETISNQNIYTYNFENGKIVPTKVERDEKFQSKENKKYTINKFAFPNVKDGSVVEYSYTIFSPFLGSTDRVIIEDEIPVRYVEYVFDAPKPIGYTINYKGSLSPTHRETGPRNIYGGEYETYRFAYENVPAYKEEKYVLNNDNYKTGIKAELNSTFINNELTSYALSWNDVRKRLYEHDNFGSELRRQNYVKDLLPSDIKEISSLKDRARAVLKYVQKNYTWDERNDVVTDKGIRNLVSTKIGNSAEINILLILLLRNADIEAHPVVLSTVNNGMLLSYNPSIAQLNFVLAGVIDNNQIHLLDGTVKQSDINLISPKALNYYGLLMTKDEVKQINIGYPEISQTLLTVDAKMNPDGTFEGNFADRDTKLFALMVNESYVEDKEKYAKSYQEIYKFPYSNLKQGLQENNDFETSFDFTADTFVDNIGKKLVFNPLLFLYSPNHNFDEKEPRKAPLEFYSGYEKIKKVTVTIPDDYVFENVPKSKKFRTDDDGLAYSYIVTQAGNKLTVETNVQVTDYVFPKEYYPAFTQIFDNITKLEAQVVTAVKKQ